MERGLRGRTTGVEAPLEMREGSEALRERHGQKECEQHLHPREEIGELAEELGEVAVDSLRLCLVALDLERFGIS